MIGLLCFVLAVWASPFKSQIRLAAENAALRHQLIVLRRKLRGRVQLANSDRWFLVQLYRWFPSILKVLTIIRPETLVRWHRAGFRSYWRWKSRLLGGRPQIETGLRALIRQMSMENPLWGAPRIHGELLKLGFEVAQSSVAKYMVKRRGPPGQGWLNHQEAYSQDGACTNWAEEYFSRLRRAEIGIHHHIAGAYLLRYAQESSWREDNRRVSNGDQVNRITALAMKRGKSVDFTGYWQRHIVG
jgi:type II secretory pathway pseudopilin PulG